MSHMCVICDVEYGTWRCKPVTAHIPQPTYKDVPVSRFSSSMSTTLREVPHSRIRCRGVPYVSHGLCSATSPASPHKSSRTSISSSSSASMPFQYSTILSSSVHSRITTQTGRCSSGRNACSTLPSLASPSDAMTTVHRWPLARSRGASSCTRCTTCKTPS